MAKGSYQQELDNFFAVHEQRDTPYQAITKAALTQARKNLSHTAFIDLNHRVIAAYYSNNTKLKTWKNHRLCAIDGSQLRLPSNPQIIQAFGVNGGKESQKDCPLALASVYYDVLNHISIDSSVNHTNASERECAELHLEHAHPHDLSLLDRGYNAFWMYSLYQSKGLHFCMRARVKRGLQFQSFADSGQSEKVITLKPNKSSIKKCLQKGLPINGLKLRLVRVELGNNEVEVLITNLMDKCLYPASEFKSLYHLRWGVEENYKRLKQWVEIENFSGKSVLSVKQDFYAKILTSNLTSMLANAAQKKIEKTSPRRKYDYQVNFAQAITKTKNIIVALLVLPACQLNCKLMALIDYLACTFEPIRNGRSYARSKSKMKNNLHFTCYKRAK